MDFKGEEKQQLMDVINAVPTIVDIYLDRPAVIPEITAGARAIIGNYGVSDRNLLEILFGNATPAGKLPFELPSSMDAVRPQQADVPRDSENPLFEYGFGME
ncbi:MAG: glycoside hydrolase family 3 C-terminal domain-containing protein [Lewinella sp.]